MTAENTNKKLAKMWNLTLCCPLLPHGYNYKAFCARTG